MREISPPSEPASRQASDSRSDAESSFNLPLRAREGDAGALNDLRGRYLPRLHEWAHGRLPAWTRGSLDTQHLVQDTLTQEIRRIHMFEPRHDGALQACIRQAMHKRICDEIRRAKRRPVGPLDSTGPTSDPSPLEDRSSVSIASVL
jgi:DNA-directed RNA polymerase specialized sigma24 family protein